MVQHLVLLYYDFVLWSQSWIIEIYNVMHLSFFGYKIDSKKIKRKNIWFEEKTNQKYQLL